MQASAQQGFPMVIAAVIGVLAIVFIVLKKLRGGGEGDAPSGSAQRRQDRKPVVAAVAVVTALGAGMNILLQEGRARAGSVVADTLAGGGTAGRTSWMPVTIAIAVLAAVALVVMLLRLRDGSR